MPVTIEDVPPVCVLTAFVTSVLTVVDVTTDPNTVWAVVKPFPTRRTPAAPLRLEEGEMVSFITTPGVLHSVLPS